LFTVLGPEISLKSADMLPEGIKCGFEVLSMGFGTGFEAA